jgi:hypothetical protein
MTPRMAILSLTILAGAAVTQQPAAAQGGIGSGEGAAVGSGLRIFEQAPKTNGQIPLTPAVLQTLLRSNHDMDFVKVGLDGDGDAFVRIEISSRLLDAQEFKKIMDQVTAATDAVYTRIKPYLK